jgi:hypothetical protein
MKRASLVVLFLMITQWSLAFPVREQQQTFEHCKSILDSHGSFSEEGPRPVRPRILAETGRYVLEQLRVLRPTLDYDPVQMTWKLPGENIVRPNEQGDMVSLLRPGKPWVKWNFAPPFGSPSVQAVNGFDFGMPSYGFYEALYSRYGDNFDQELLRAAIASEESLDSYRADHGEVVRHTADGPQMMGQIRVYSGSHSRHHQGWLMDPHGRYLPFEAFLEQRGLLQQNSLYRFFRDAIEAGDPEFRFFEIGKLTANGTAVEREAIIAAFEEFLLGYYLNVFPKSIFIAHVVTPFHLRFFTRRYQMTKLYSINVGEGKQEHVLFMTGQHFKRRILELRGGG